MTKKNKPMSLEKLAPQTRQLIEVLRDGSDDLACAITGAAFLDHCLAALLQQFLVDGETSTGLLQPGRPLGEFAARYMLCYSLGLIGDSIRANLELIGRIRNRFAHELFDISFSDEEVMRLCNELNPLWVDLSGVKSEPVNRDKAREAFTISVGLLAQRLLQAATLAKHREKLVDQRIKPRTVDELKALMAGEG